MRRLVPPHVLRAHAVERSARLPPSVGGPCAALVAPARRRWPLPLALAVACRARRPPCVELVSARPRPWPLRGRSRRRRRAPSPRRRPRADCRATVGGAGDGSTIDAPHVTLDAPSLRGTAGGSMDFVRGLWNNRIPRRTLAFYATLASRSSVRIGVCTSSEFCLSALSYWFPWYSDCLLLVGADWCSFVRILSKLAYRVARNTCDLG